MRSRSTVLCALLLLTAAAAPAAATPSDDEGRIAFTRWSGLDDDPTSIMTVRPDGTGFVTIVGHGNSPAWSPNGRQVAFVRTYPYITTEGDLFVARADGTGERRLYDGGDLPLASPSFAPDGRRIAFLRHSSLHILDVVTGSVEVVAIDGCDDSVGSVDWAPHGDRLAVSTGCRDGTWHRIWTVGADGRNPQQLTHGSTPGVYDFHPRWSPDGQRIAFVRHEMTDAGLRAEVHVMDADGSDQARVVTGTDRDTEPAWSPGGAWLVFARDAGDGRSLYRIRPDGSGLTRVSQPPAPVAHYAPAWQPRPALTAAACPEGRVPDAGFTDVSGTHRPAVDCAAWHQLARGTSDTTYLPAAPVRRDQAASFVARLLLRAGVELPPPQPQGFRDIEGNVHADAINQLAELGIVRGVAADRYAPTQALTRGQMASLLVRAMEHVLETTLPRPFDEFGDDDGGAHEAAIDKAAHAGVVSGVTTSTYRPGAEIRRDQMAGLLARTADVLVRSGHLTLPH